MHAKFSITYAIKIGDVWETRRFVGLGYFRNGSPVDIWMHALIVRANFRAKFRRHKKMVSVRARVRILRKLNYDVWFSNAKTKSKFASGLLFWPKLVFPLSGRFKLYYNEWNSNAFIIQIVHFRVKTYTTRFWYLHKNRTVVLYARRIYCAIIFSRMCRVDFAIWNFSQPTVTPCSIQFWTLILSRHMQPFQTRGWHWRRWNKAPCDVSNFHNTFRKSCRKLTWCDMTASTLHNIQIWTLSTNAYDTKSRIRIIILFARLYKKIVSTAAFINGCDLTGHFEV